MNGRWILLASGIAGSLLTACSPPGDGPPAPRNLAGESSERTAPVRRPQIDEGTEAHFALKMVQTAYAANDTNRTYAAWVLDELDSGKGSMLFPRWRAIRTGTYKYTVKFDYVLVNEQGDISRTGYAWTADLVLKTVSPPRILRPDELQKKTLPRPPAGTNPPILLQTD